MTSIVSSKLSKSSNVAARPFSAEGAQISNGLGGDTGAVHRRCRPIQCDGVSQTRGALLSFELHLPGGSTSLRPDRRSEEVPQSPTEGRVTVMFARSQSLITELLVPHKR